MEHDAKEKQHIFLFYFDILSFAFDNSIITMLSFYAGKENKKGRRGKSKKGSLAAKKLLDLTRKDEPKGRFKTRQKKI